MSMVLKVPVKVLGFLRRESVENAVRQAREQVTNKGMTFVSLIEKKVFATTQDGKIVSTDLVDGKIGDFVDMAEDFGVRETDVERDKVRIANAYVEAVIGRDRVAAAQHIRDLLGYV